MCSGLTHRRSKSELARRAVAIVARTVILPGVLFLLFSCQVGLHVGYGISKLWSMVRGECVHKDGIESIPTRASSNYEFMYGIKTIKRVDCSTI